MGKELIRVVAAVIERDGRYLITQRTAGAVLPSLWEFPGGRVEPGESDEQALVREVRGRIGVDIEIECKMGEHDHRYEHYDVHMNMFVCHLPAGVEPKAVAVKDIRWVTSDQMGEYEFPPADERTMSKLIGWAE